MQIPAFVRGGEFCRARVYGAAANRFGREELDTMHATAGWAYEFVEDRSGSIRLSVRWGTVSALQGAGHFFRTGDVPITGDVSGTPVSVSLFATAGRRSRWLEEAGHHRDLSGNAFSGSSWEADFSDINEIMYHPASEDDREEIELLNRDTRSISSDGGWPGVLSFGGMTLVVAADRVCSPKNIPRPSRSSVRGKQQLRGLEDGGA